jgi:hypothetical protein
MEMERTTVKNRRICFTFWQLKVKTERGFKRGRERETAGKRSKSKKSDKKHV